MPFLRSRYSRFAAIFIACVVLLSVGYFLVIRNSGEYGKNLITNPGAEDGPGASDSTAMSPPAWRSTGALTSVQYGASGGFPNATSPGPSNRGKNVFVGGPSVPQSTGTQTITLTVPPADIDNERVQYVLSAWLGGYESQADHAAVTVTFLSQDGKLLDQAVIGPVTAADRANETSSLLRSTKGILPKGTRSVTITMLMTRTDGDYNDGSADNLSFILKKA